MFSYPTLFPSFAGEMTTLNNLALMVSYTILLGSFVLSAQHATEGGKVLNHIYKYAALIAVIVVAPNLCATFYNALWVVAGNMELNIGQNIYNDMLKSLQTQNPPATQSGWWSSIASALDGTQVLTLLVTGALLLLIFICMVIIWVVYLFQWGFAAVMQALMPIAIACLATQGWNSWGIRWITTYIGIICWPLGMTIVLMGTENLITTTAFNSVLQSSPLLSSISYLDKMAFAAVYTIIGLIVAPGAISAVADSGGSIGGALASGGMQLGTQIAGAAYGLASAGGSGGGGGGNDGGPNGAPEKPKPSNIPDVCPTGPPTGGPPPPPPPIRVGPLPVTDRFGREDLNPVMK